MSQLDGVDNQEDPVFPGRMKREVDRLQKQVEKLEQGHQRLQEEADQLRQEKQGTDEDVLHFQKEKLLLEMQISRLSLENQRLQTQGDKLDPLHDTAIKILAAPDMDDTLNEIANSAVSLVKADEGAVLLVDSWTNDLYMRAYQGERDAVARKVRIKSDDKNILEAMESGKPVHKFEETGIKVATDFLPVSIIYIPIRAEERVIGIIYVGNKTTDRRFTEKDEMQLSALAHYAAPAIENTKRTKMLTSLHIASDALLADRELLDVLQDMANQATEPEVLGADVVVVYQYDQAKGDLILPPITEGKLRDPEILNQRGGIVPHRDAIVFKVIELGKPFYAHDAQKDWNKINRIWITDSEEPRSFVLREGIASSAGVPLIAEGKVVGVAFFNYRIPQLFSDTEQQAIELFANQAAIAILNAILHKEYQQRIDELDALNQIGLEIGLTSDLLEFEDVLQIVYEQTAKLMEVFNFYIAICTKTRNGLLVSFKFEIVDGEKVWGTKPRERLNKNGLTEYIYRNPRPLLIERDVGTWAKGKDNVKVMGRENTKSWLGVPMIIGNKVLGIISVQSYTTPNAYNERHKKVLQTIASQAAIAIQNVRLHEERKRTIEKLKHVLEISEVLLSPPIELRVVLQQIVDNARKVVGSDQARFFPYDDDKKSFQADLIVESGWPVDRIGPIKPPRPDGATAKVVEEGLLVLEDVHDQRKHPYIDLSLESNIIRAGTQSSIGVRLDVANRTVGVLYTDSRTERQFSAEEVQTVKLFANQAALAIQEARILQESKQRELELEALHQTSLEITQELDRDKLLQTTVERAAMLLNAPASGLYLRQGSQRRLVAEYTHNQDRLRGRAFEFGQGLAGRVAESGKAQYINEYSTWEDRDIRLDAPEYHDLFRSVVEAPLIWQDEVIGVLVVYDIEGEREFNDNDVKLLALYGQQAAIAIKKAEMLEEGRLQKAFLADLGGQPRERPVNSREDLQYQLADRFEQVCRFFKAEYLVFFASVRENDTVLQAVAHVGLPYDVEQDPPHFNWKKAGFQPRDPDEAEMLRGENKILTEWKPNEEWRQKTVENMRGGDNPTFFEGLACGVPVRLAEKYRGLLVFGPLEDSPDLAAITGFLRTIAQHLGTDALSWLQALDLRAQQKQAERSVRMIIHRSKTSLMPIAGKFGLIKYLADANSDIQHTAAEGEDITVNLSNVITRAFTTGTVEIRKSDLDFQWYSLPALVGNCAETFQNQATATNRTLVIDKSIDFLPHADLDSGILSVALGNLIDNALKYSFEKTKIELVGELVANQYVKIAVKDEGERLPELARDNLGKPGQRWVETKRARSIPGHGYGLWEAYQIAKAHGGSLDFYSVLTSRGSYHVNVWIQIPLIQSKR
jgi:GAF domain-containing protein/signal transduction histidine kinase